MTLLSAKEISKAYGKNNVFMALNGVSLEVQEGEVIAIIGKSGSGKSTLMHLLAALDKPSNGDISYRDQSYKKMKERELNKLRNSDFGFIFQQFYLNPKETVLNNVALPLKIAGVKKSERERRSREIIEQMGLADKVGSKAKDLSGGQQQRVSIARALVNNPRVIFADEPTGNLDSENGENVIKTLFEMREKNKITVVIVTHDEDIANRADRRIFIKDGKIESVK